MKEENKNYEIVNKSVFTNIDDYHQFTNGWKAFLNAGKAKIERDSYGLRESPLSSEYHLFYGLARNKQVTGFKPESAGLAKAFVNMKKLSNAELEKVFGYRLNDSLIKYIQTLNY